MKLTKYFTLSNIISSVLFLFALCVFVSALFGISRIILIISIGLLLLLIIINTIFSIRNASFHSAMSRKLDEASQKGLSESIEISFDTRFGGNLGNISRNLNNIFNETKRAFWDIRENLFETKIHYSIIENMKLVMISYIQKVVNIGNVKDKLGIICSRIGDATGSVRAILTSIIELANRTSEQAAAVNQASDALAKLFSVIDRITDITSTNREMTSELERTTRSGGERIEKTLQIISRLDEGTGEMLSIIGIIDDIAESTNLLSINAGIEAAHTGSIGKGFRVIADEIMKLVLSTKKNAANISTLLKDQVRNINGALSESRVSGSVFKEVNNRVEGAVRTWVEVAKNIEEMSHDTKLIHEATEKMIGITKIVKDSSDTVRLSIEKIEREIADLLHASDETRDILEKITSENEEEKKSTFEVLQQLNKVTKFVVNLNKAIDFFNIGKKIFCLYSSTGAYSDLMFRIVEEEYEVYGLDSYKSLPKILKEYSNSILFIDKKGVPPDIAPDDIIQSIMKKTSVKNLLIFLLTDNTIDTNIKKSETSKFEIISLDKNDQAENVKTISDLLVKHKAKGLRKYIRVECGDKESTMVTYRSANRTFRHKVINISSAAIMCDFKDKAEGDQPIKVNEITLEFEGMKIDMPCRDVVEKDDNSILFVLDLKNKPEIKKKLYTWIYKKLQDKMKDEFDLIRD